MSGLETPDNIFTEILNKRITLYSGTKSLISLMQNNGNNINNVQCKSILKILSTKYPEILQILFQLLEFDQKPINRLIIAREIILNFDDGAENLKNQIQKDFSASFLTEFYIFLCSHNSKTSELLKHLLLGKYKDIYSVVYEEAIFFLELEASQINIKKDLDFNFGYFKRFEAPNMIIFKKDSLFNYVVKNHHVLALDLSRWEFESLPETFNVLTELRILNLSDLKLKLLPASISLLTQLEYLNLCGNNLRKIPLWLVSFAKKSLSKNYIKEGVEKSEAIILSLMEILCGRKLIKKSEDFNALNSEIALNYKINKIGNAIGIYIIDEKINIGILPEEICSLHSLEELVLPGNQIEVIPKNLGKLQSLRHLNLSFNRISFIPNSINNLRRLETLIISENNIPEKTIMALQWNKLGEEFLESGEYDKTIEECKSTLILYPKNKIAWFHLGIAYNEKSELSRAKHAYKEFLNIDPKSSVVWNSLGDIYHQEGAFKKAIIAIKRALEIEPTIALLWDNLGYNYKKLGKIDDALKAYKKSLEIDPLNNELWREIASVYREKGEITKAIESEEKALDLDSRTGDRKN
ncbi:hypothetical protein LCGC14_1075130 [marine sediment metagenome]|uniref:Uncharacterized protein n=1 Tax=marine sediment metagenome TaxID=412755 RepID=A0A0F9MGV2_9ZZZZ